MNHQRHERRGLIILLVLSMLVLFLVMGATLLVIATRARTASRAFLAASDKSDAAAPILPRTILDEALLLLIRGSLDLGPPAPAGAETIIRESLLGDMYGYTSVADATEKNRVPFRDGLNDTPPLVSPYGESHDAFDDDNPFLSKVSSDGTVQRAAFQPVGFSGSYQVDNDGDGVLDGLWFPTTPSGTKLFGDATSSGGSQLSFRVSYLVLDLDGRINVNAHGESVVGASLYGPASVDPSAITGNETLTFIQSYTSPLGGSGARNHAIIPRNVRQSPVLAATSRSIPGRGGEPYTLRLDLNGNAQADLTGSVPANNPFTVSELERVLRPFDSDWATLPPRLASMVTDLDGAARRTLTTDSWDVPFMTGRAAPPAGGTIRPKFDLTGKQWGARPAGLDKNADADKATYANELFDSIQVVFPASTPPAGTEQWCANVAEYWALSANKPAVPMTVGGVPDLTGVVPSDFPARVGAPPEEVGLDVNWSGGAGKETQILSAADLLAVPKGSKAEIEALFPPLPAGRDPTTDPIVSLASEAGNQRILDAVGVPSPFTATTQNERSLNLDVGANAPQAIPVREPGRVNVNTCSDEVWEAVCGDARAKDAVTMTSTWGIVKHAWDAGDATNDVTGVRRERGNRLALAATVRSNVFAVWITLEVSDDALDAGPPTLFRLFAIVDRSIPVNYARGVNTVQGLDGAGVQATTDVRNIIRLKRYLN
jgi:hypothetical protein